MYECKGVVLNLDLALCSPTTYTRNVSLAGLRQGRWLGQAHGGRTRVAVETFHQRQIDRILNHVFRRLEKREFGKEQTKSQQECFCVLHVIDRSPCLFPLSPSALLVIALSRSVSLPIWVCVGLAPRSVCLSFTLCRSRITA